MNIFVEFIIMGLPILLLIIISGNLIFENKLSIGTFMAFSSYIYLFFTPLSELSENWMNYKSALPALERINYLYNINLKFNTGYE